MKTQIYRLDACHKAQGLCVVIDVLRAFTTAAFAFAAGALEILMVATVEEVFQKHRSSQVLMRQQDRGLSPL